MKRKANANTRNEKERKTETGTIITKVGQLIIKRIKKDEFINNFLFLNIKENHNNIKFY